MAEVEIGGQIPGSPYRRQKNRPLFFNLLCISCNFQKIFQLFPKSPPFGF